MDLAESRDIYEILNERDRAGSIIVTCNRGPDEWLATFADPVRAQSAIDRFTSNAYDLVIEGESYRRRLKPGRRQQRLISTISGALSAWKTQVVVQTMRRSSFLRDPATSISPRCDRRRSETLEKRPHRPACGRSRRSAVETRSITACAPGWPHYSER